MPTKSKSLTTTKPELAEGARMPPLHPGEMLREDFMKPRPRKARMPPSDSFWEILPRTNSGMRRLPSE